MSDFANLSIAVPTLLMVVGLTFFIRASVKERTETAQFSSDRPVGELLDRLQTYFRDRGYRAIAADPDRQSATYEGQLRPSWFLAIFLTVLAAVGVLCLALVVAALMPQLTAIVVSLTLLSPLAGWFYWRNAGRSERVRIEVDSSGDKVFLTVTGHRDETIQMRRSLPIEDC